MVDDSTSERTVTDGTAAANPTVQPNTNAADARQESRGESVARGCTWVGAGGRERDNSRIF